MLDTTTLESNKQTVLDFYETAFNAKDLDAVGAFLGAEYVQHNPEIGDGLDGLLTRLAFIKESFPDLRANAGTAPRGRDAGEHDRQLVSAWHLHAVAAQHVLHRPTFPTGSM